MEGPLVPFQPDDSQDGVKSCRLEFLEPLWDVSDSPLHNEIAIGAGKTQIFPEVCSCLFRTSSRKSSRWLIDSILTHFICMRQLKERIPCVGSSSEFDQDSRGLIIWPQKASDTRAPTLGGHPTQNQPVGKRKRKI